MSNECICVGNIFDDANNPQNGRIYSPKGISPTILHGRKGGYDQQPKIIIYEDEGTEEIRQDSDSAV